MIAVEDFKRDSTIDEGRSTSPRRDCAQLVVPAYSCIFRKELLSQEAMTTKQEFRWHLSY